MDGSRADWKIGVDIGGTFMDFCALEAVTGRVASLKVLTTPDDPGAELLEGLRLLAEREGQLALLTNGYQPLEVLQPLLGRWLEHNAHA